VKITSLADIVSIIKNQLFLRRPNRKALRSTVNEKMKNNILFSLIISSFLIGCMESPQDLNKLTKESASSPEFVTDTPKGKLYKIIIYRDFGRNDRVYFLDTNSPITINSDENKGAVKSIIIIDGAEYIRKSQK